MANTMTRLIARIRMGRPIRQARSFRFSASRPGVSLRSVRPHFPYMPMPPFLFPGHSTSSLILQEMQVDLNRVGKNFVDVAHDLIDGVLCHQVVHHVLTVL